MIAVYIPVTRRRVMELYAFLDLHDPEWLYFNTYEREPATRERHDRVRSANTNFIAGCSEDQMGMNAEVCVCVSPKAAMAIRLSWMDTIVLDLKEPLCGL